MAEKKDVREGTCLDQEMWKKNWMAICLNQIRQKCFLWVMRQKYEAEGWGEGGGEAMLLLGKREILEGSPLVTKETTEMRRRRESERGYFPRQ